MSDVRECAGCKRPTRPARAMVADFPGTVLRRLGDLCDTCHGLRGPKVVRPRTTENTIENTIAGLESFLRRRRDRETAMMRRGSTP